MSSRCQCLMHFADGEVRRCSQMVLNPNDSMCYNHKKYFENDQTPAPQLWKYPYGKDGYPSSDYLVKVTDLHGNLVRTFDYTNHLTPAVMMW